VGGRIRSLHKAAGTKLTVELAGEFIDTDHTCLRDLAKELGFKIVDLLAAERGLVKDTFFFEGRRVPIREIIRDFAPVAKQIDKDLKAIANFESYAKPDPAAAASEILEDLRLQPSAVQQRTRPLNLRRGRSRPFARPRQRR